MVIPAKGSEVTGHDSTELRDSVGGYQRGH